MRDVYAVNQKTGAEKDSTVDVEIPDSGVKIPDAPDYDKIGLKMMDKRVLFQDFPHAQKIGRVYVPRVGDVGVAQARVVAIGDKVTQCEVGDIIYKIAELGQTILTPIGEFRFLPEDMVIAIVKDGNAASLIPPIKDDAA